MNGYKFNSLKVAREFANRTHKPHFVFAAPTTGFIVVDSRTANQLWADGHSDIVWSTSLQQFVTIPQ
jgi:prepilin-type processing-associated H-X9-DG protein